MDKNLSQAAMTTHRCIVRAAGASVFSFLWLYVFGYFARTMPINDAFARTLLLYALSEAVSLLGTPIAMRYIRGSMIRGLVFGTATLAIAYSYVGVLFAGLFPHGAAIIGILFGLNKALYRAPYELEMRRLIRAKNSVSQELLFALMPVVAGSLLSFGLPFASLMFIAAILSLMALVLLALVGNVRETFSWGYRQTFVQFLHEKNISLVFPSIMLGARSVALIILWPLALVALGVRSPGLLGALVSAILLISVVFGSGRGYRAIEAAADGGSYVDEYTALKEMGRAFGAACACGAIAFLAILF